MYSLNNCVVVEPECSTKKGRNYMNTLESINKFYSLTEIQNMLGMSHKSVLHYVNAGLLKAYRIGEGGKYRVAEEDLKDFLQREMRCSRE